MMATESPNGLYESLLVKLATVLELTQRQEVVSLPQAKQALLQATNDFKNSINQAKEFADTLPGGELQMSDQDEVVEMLIELRDRKRGQLQQFISQQLASASAAADSSMEIDSTASTPFND
ncbi:hypothetical protein BD779DRAFT_1447646 [Infundibulicybe gibba]|nr:hypothetical protein BD779DRAFT_1447646 [Infundibulicybe gibba]